jgi:hypothetical protein
LSPFQVSGQGGLMKMRESVLVYMKPPRLEIPHAKASDLDAVLTGRLFQLGVSFACSTLNFSLPFALMPFFSRDAACLAKPTA